MSLKRMLPHAAVYYKSILLVVTLISVAAIYRLGDLSISISGQELTVSDSETRAFHEATLEIYGSDEQSLLIIQDERLFDPAKLSALKDTLRHIESLPYVQETQSLFSIQHLRNVEGTVTWGPYIDTLPETPAQGRQILQTALQNPLIRDSLLTQDGSTMAVIIRFAGGWKDRYSEREIVDGIEQAIAPLKPHLDNVFQMGRSTVRDAITQNILNDQLTLLPLSLLVMLAALILGMRRSSYALVPLVTAGLSIVWTLGFMAMLGISLNVLNAIVPALLVIVGSTEDIHLLSAYRAGIQEGHSRADALQYMASTTGWAVLMTFVTSYVGFLSIVSNDIEILRQFGWVASTGLLFNFLITTLLVPIFLRFFGEGPSTASSHRNFLGQMMLGLFPILQKYKRHIAVLTSGLLALSVIAATQVRLSNDLMDYFPHDAPIRLQAETIQNQLGGMRRLDIVLDGQIEGTFLKLRYLEEIEKLQDHLRQTGLFEKSISFVDYLKLVHQVMDEIEGEQLYLPEDDAIVQEYANFIEQRHIESYVSEDFSGARIVILHAIDASRELGQAVEELRRYIEQYIDPDLEVRVTGESVLSNEATSYITWGQGKSLTVMLVIIVLIVTALFTKLTAGLIAIVPNLIPVTVLFGVMGLWGIPLNTGTAMIAAIAIGIAVDDTIHFMTRYNQQLHLSSTRLQALCNTMEEEAHPIILTSIALALGFATLGFSDFPPVRHFGLLSALVILVALIANFVITPLLLSHVRLVTVWDLLAVRLKSHIVDRCPLFKDMSLWEVRKTVLLSRCVRHAAGSAIFEQGEAGQEMYVILDGQIEMRHRNDAGEICVLDTLRPGQVFGVTALAAEVPRPVTMVATKNSELLALRWEGLRRIGHLFPYLSTKLYRNVSTIIGKRLAAELEHIDNCENPCGKSGSEPNDGMPIDRQTMINI